MSNHQPIMSTPKPYIVRAFYDWVVDNQCTPFMAVDATLSDVLLPDALRKQSQVVLNLSASAAIGLAIGQTHVDFRARFGGVLSHVSIPMTAILGLYAQENGEGVLFLEDDGISIIGSGWREAAEDAAALSVVAPQPAQKKAAGSTAKKGGGPSLKVVAINPEQKPADES